jgi:hypothetical protein
MTSYGRMSDIVLFGKASERICQAPKGSLVGGAERSTRDFVQFLLFCLAVDMFIYRRELSAPSSYAIVFVSPENLCSSGPSRSHVCAISVWGASRKEPIVLDVYPTCSPSPYNSLELERSERTICADNRLPYCKGLTDSHE